MRRAEALTTNYFDHPRNRKSKRAQSAVEGRDRTKLRAVGNVMRAPRPFAPASILPHEAEEVLGRL